MISDRSLILCNGMPEYLYAKSLQMGLPRHLQSSVSVIQDIHSANSAIASMKAATKMALKAKEGRHPFKKVWVISNRPDLSDTKVRAILEKENLHAAYCPVCIEQWYMLHFEEYDPNLRCAQDAASKLSELWPRYRKYGTDAYAELADRIPLAIGHAASARDQIFEANNDLEPVFTIQQLITFFNSLRVAA